MTKRSHDPFLTAVLFAVGVTYAASNPKQVSLREAGAVAADGLGIALIGIVHATIEDAPPGVSSDN